MINADIPIIFLTAKNLKEDILEGFKIGADDYIFIPGAKKLNQPLIITLNHGVRFCRQIRIYEMPAKNHRNITVLSYNFV